MPQGWASPFSRFLNSDLFSLYLVHVSFHLSPYLSFPPSSIMPSPLQWTYAVANLTDKPNTPSTTQTIIRHHQYYLPGRDLFILIDTTLFHVHKYFFEQEATKFFVPPYTNPDNNTPCGTFASHPIIFHGISIYDFKQFLWVFYNPQLSLYNNTPGNWWSIGRLAGLWGFQPLSFTGLPFALPSTYKYLVG